MAWWVRVFFLLVLSSCAVENAQIGHATVVHPGGKGRVSVIEYRVGAKRYMCSGPRQSYLVKGEHFQLVYDANQPWKHKLLMEAPLFLTNEATLYTEGKVLHSVSGTYSKVTFSYEVNGKVYKKRQVINGLAGLKRRDNCVVRYSLEDPARSILTEKQFTNPATAK